MESRKGKVVEGMYLGLKGLSYKDFGNIYFDVQDTLYEQHNHLKEYRKKKREKFFDERVRNSNYVNVINNRIISIEEEKDKTTIKIGNSYYEDYVKTELFYHEKVHKLGKRDNVFEDNYSQLVNKLGTNGLVKTSDGKFILNKRSDKVVVSKGLVTLSFTGGVNGLKSGTLKDNLDVLIGKESMEELGLGLKDYTEINFMGLFRKRSFCMKPELLFYLKTHLTEEEVKERFKKAEDSWESNGVIFSDKLSEDEIRKYGKATEYLLVCEEYLKGI